MQPEQSGVKTWQWVVTVVVIIALIIIGIFVFGNKKAEAPVATESTLPSSLSANSIVMSNQFPGNVVYISSITAEKSGWVAVQKDNAGQPGAVIGYSAVAAGTAPVKVTLTEPTIDGGTYYAVMYSDIGDSKFDVTKDLPLKDTKGNVIMRLFKATVLAGSEIKG